MPLPRRALAVVATCAAVLAGCADFPEEKLRCEEAVAHLLDCCPGVAASPVVCEYTNNGWGFPLTGYYFPKVECLIGLSCADLTARGACTWAADPAHAPAVCP